MQTTSEVRRKVCIQNRREKERVRARGKKIIINFLLVPKQRRIEIEQWTLDAR